MIVCKDIDTGERYVYRNVTMEEASRSAFLDLSRRVTLLVGHNLLGYDLPVLCDLLPDFTCDVSNCIDTLVVSRLVDYSRPNGHSIEAYGEEFGLEKIKFNDWTKWSQEMEDYCVRDVDINYLLYRKLLPVLESRAWQDAITLEQTFQYLVVNELRVRGFSFNVKRGEHLLERVSSELAALDKEILNAFPARLHLVREIIPVATKHGTIHKKDFRWVQDGDLSQFSVGAPFCLCRWEEFNPASHKQLIDVLHAARWKPVDKTKTHIELERSISRLKYHPRQNEVAIELQQCYDKKLELEKYGWRVNETNLETLPSTAPSPARLLAKRILYESRRRTLTEWLSLVDEDSRIHGDFYGIGAWTHRMAHQRPNMANIPNEFRTDGTKQLLGKEMRGLWQAPKGRLLVGVDAEGIQLRIFAHYIDDTEFTRALVEGKKEDKSDPHSLNQRILGGVCKSRQAAKRFIYALLLGAGLDKLAEVLGCSRTEAEEALSRLMARYQGFEFLKREIIPADARRGYFVGIDGREVKIPGETVGQRKHLCMSGYLQNGEAIIIKRTGVKAAPRLVEFDSFFVDVVHDEFQAETPNDMVKALAVARIIDSEIAAAGVYYKLKCPMQGSYYNGDHRDFTIGTNWAVTH